ncbi:MAG TPA: AAA family ATPase [Chitinivibrionales bacterium]|nr:AAA family ATPase [Chitinivibrionales bacterium]
MKGLKLAVSGKGGVGKSTLAAALCKVFSQKGLKVLAIDADPDANLASALGLSQERKTKIRPIASETGLIEQRTGAKPGRTGQMFSLSPDVSDVAQKYGLLCNGVSLLVLGAVKSGGGGCACPENAFLKKLIRHLIVQEGETVVIDLEPGIEHLGRATASGVDAMIIVLEPGTRSKETAQRIIALSKDIGLEKKLFFVLNKIRNKDDEKALLTDEFAAVKVLGKIPFDERFIDADCRGVSIFDLPGSENLRANFITIAGQIMSLA